MASPETPLAAGGQLGEWLAGTYAAVAAVAALREARRSGCGDHLDVAMLDCMAVSMVTFPSLFAEFAAACGHRPPAGASRTIEVPSVEPSADGWVNFTTNSAQQFSDFAQLIGSSGTGPRTRGSHEQDHAFTHRDEFWPLVHAYTEPRSSSQIIEEARRSAHPRGAGTATAETSWTSSNSLHGTCSWPIRRGGSASHVSRTGSPVSIPRVRPGTGSRSDDDGAIGWPAPIRGVEDRRVADATPGRASGRPDCLVGGAIGHQHPRRAGCRCDQGRVGASARPDALRQHLPPDQPNWWEWGPLFHAANTNKRGVTIDLVRSEGQALDRAVGHGRPGGRELTPRVMDQFGLAWDDVHRLNPALCMVRMPAFGLDGPWRDRPGFAQTMESLTGLAWLTGHPDGPPTLVRGAGDPLGGLHAALAALIALSWRDDDGGGRMVEATMVESVLNAAAEQSIDWQLTGEVMSRRGNRSQGDTVPQGVYACASDEWIAVAVESDRQWRSLCAITGDPSLDSSVPSELAGTDLSHVDARRAHHDAIDRWISSLTGAADAADLVEQLVDAGIPAAVVIKPSAITDNPQLRHRGLFETEVHPVTGNHHVPGLPFRSERVHRWIRIPSPTLGQHNDEVLAEVGVAPGELELLRDARVIGETLDPR